jgi:hypothetical protein
MAQNPSLYPKIKAGEDGVKTLKLMMGGESTFSFQMPFKVLFFPQLNVWLFIEFRGSI